MRDPKRIKRILEMLEELWSKPSNADMRFGQLLENYVFTMIREKGIWFQEDDITEEMLEYYLEVK